MQKQAPSLGRILVAVGFALSCFGLLLFLWVAFGGPTPLKPKSYRFTTDFPEATTLALEADVRIGGVTVGKVKSLELAPDEDATRAEIEIAPEFAPISSDARAILRQKTLLGETYIELTPGTEPSGGTAPASLGAQGGASDAAAEAAEPIHEGGHLASSQVRDATQIDEIFNALDEETRASFQRWQASAAIAIRNRGLDLNDALGSLGPFVDDAATLTESLRRESEALRGVVRDTGAVFEALTAGDRQLSGAITGAHDAFGALASQERRLAETFEVLPTFLRESRVTLERLEEFRSGAHPLVRDLIPVARDLTPTLASAGRISPHLESLFVELDELVDVAAEGLPALRGFLVELGPVLEVLDPFLANLNPVVRFLEYQKRVVTDFLAGPPIGLANVLDPFPGQPAPRHALRQLAYLSAESLGIHRTRLNTNRGNGYLRPLGYGEAAAELAFTNFDCKNTDYTAISQDPDDQEATFGNDPRIGPGFAPCVVADDFPGRFGGGHAPQITADP